MENYKIEKTRLRYIVPFEFDVERMGFEAACKLVDNYRDFPYSFLGVKNNSYEGRWIRCGLRRGEQDLFSYIIDEFAIPWQVDYDKTVEKNGCFWRYDSFEKNPFPLMYTQGTRFDVNGLVCDLKLTDMGLYVFRSGVGLLWYEISYDQTKISDSHSLIRFQNVFKELDRGTANHLWINAANVELPDRYVKGERKYDVIPFLFGNWISERLDFLHVRYQASRKNSYAGLLAGFFYGKKEGKGKWKEFYNKLPAYCPDKAILFTYALFERPNGWKKNKDSLSTIYCLTGGYKESYEMSLDIEEQVRNPYANVYWFATRGGCGYYAWPSKDNHDFFHGTQYEKVMNDYFLLYIRAIYQSYSLMRYAVITSQKLPHDYRSYLAVSENTEELSEYISQIGARISLFLVKSITASVSHIHHQNEFYEYLMQRLQIREDAASVTEGLEGLKELQRETQHQKQVQQEQLRKQEKEIEEQREKEADSTFQIGLGLMTFLAAISAITDSYGLVDNIAKGSLTLTGAIIFGVLLVVCLVIFFLSLGIFIKSVRTLKKPKDKKTKVKKTKHKKTKEGK